MTTDKKEKGECKQMKGFTPIRTVRFIASLIAIFGMILFAFERILTMVYGIAANAVRTGNGLTDSFMVRFASENFSGVKKLLGILDQVKDLLPLANKGLLVLFVVSVTLMVIAAFGLTFPRQFGHVLVAMKLLKWQGGLASVTSVASDAPHPVISGKGVSKKFKSVSKGIKRLWGKIVAWCKKMVATLKKLQPKYWIFIGCALAFVLVLVFGVRGCSNVGLFTSTQSLTDELTQQTLFYIKAQKSYFAKNSKIGGPKALQMPDSLTTSYFTYNVNGSRFAATLNKNFKDCPAGSKWSVSASTKGFFTVDLVLYRQAPKDTNCTIIAPNFKNIGRK